MAKKGDYLETLVANLQSYLGPEGVDVKLRERFYSEESGKQIAEIDVAVRGEFGTSKFFWGIECRDRPADGRQGIPWIREIVGKKPQLNLDKMIAVSSTGFTEDAEKYANSQNIDLITIEDPTEDILKDWFEIFKISYTDWHCELRAPVTLNLVDPKLKPPAETLNISGGDVIFTIPPLDMQPRSLDSLIIAEVLKQTPNSKRGTLTKRIPIEIPSPLAIGLGGQVYPLKNVITEVDATPQTHSVRALFSVCHRLSDKKNIALTSTTKVQIKDKEFTFLIFAKKNVDQDGTMSIQIIFYDESGSKTTLPEGTVMHMECQY